MTFTTEETANMIINIKLSELRQYMSTCAGTSQFEKILVISNYFSDRPRLKLILDRSNYTVETLANKLSNV